jgi:enoyl-CoA hydratase/carnithine racemase
MDLLIKREERVLRITLNRPAKRNALTTAMCSGITDALTGAQDDHDIGSIFLTSNGQVFCAGLDFDEAAELTNTERTRLYAQLFSIGARSLKPIVVSVDGPALGGGLGLVAQGHVVVAEPGAVFGLPEIHIGMWPFTVYRSVAAALGRRRTQQLSLTGSTFTAHEAMHWGLVHHVCHPPVDEQERGAAIARDLARASPTAIRAGMQYVRETRGNSWERVGDLAIDLHDQLITGEDFKEGYAAMKQKREARWPSLQGASTAK